MGKCRCTAYALLRMISLSEIAKSGLYGASSGSMKDEPDMPALVSVSKMPRLCEASRAVAGTT